MTTNFWSDALAAWGKAGGETVFTQLGFTPNPGPQSTFLNLPDTDLDVLYGGAAGGSKSTSLLMYALRACVRHPGLQAFWFRRSFPELEQSVLRMLARYGNARELGASYNGSTHELRFRNGSVLTFSHAKNLVEATALQSAEINLLLIDERTTIPPDVIDMLYTRVRSGVVGVPCLGIRSATNPGGIGHSRVKTEYVDATDRGANVITDAMGRIRRFIQARLSDTPQLGPEYAAALGGSDPQLRKAFLDGDWDVFKGQVFSEWRHDRHVVPRFEIPVEWIRRAGIDYGYAAPWAVIWGASDTDGRVWLYGQEYDTQVGERDQAKRILAREAGGPAVRRAADPAMWAKVGTALPVASAYAIEGCGLVKADNDRIVGWARLHTFLKDGPACPVHREQGWDSCPMLHVLDGTCPDLVRTLPALPYDKHKVEDVDTDAEDHIADALRYLVMSIGTSPTFVFSEAATTALDGSPLMVEYQGIAYPVTPSRSAILKQKSFYAP